MSYSGKFKDKNNNLHPVTSVLYGTCDTAAATAAKVVTCTDFDTLMTGVTIRVKFANANTAASPTVNINSTGAKSVYRFGSTAPVDGNSWNAGEVVELVYDGTSFFMTGADDIAAKQDATDNSLETESKTIVGAINENAGDIGSLKSGLTDLSDHVDGSATTYPYADVITINDAVPANLADCSVKVEPVQDLHGYDKPWVGGAGKNKIDYNDTIKDITSQGLVFKENTNGYISVSGRNTGGRWGIINLSHLANGNYKIIVTCTDNQLGFRIYNGSTVIDELVPNVATNFEMTSGKSSYTIAMYMDTTGNDVDGVFTVMIVPSTETDLTFAPYTNICPISGHTEAVVTRTKPNLLTDAVWVNDHYITQDGSIGTMEGMYRYTNNYIDASENTLYAIHEHQNSVTALAMAVAYYDSNKTFIRRDIAITTTGAGDYTAQFTTPINCRYARVNVALDSDDVMMQEGVFAHDTYTIALGDTIYGGTVDFDSGVMTVDKVLVSINSTTQITANNATQYYVNQSTASGFEQGKNVISDKFESIASSTGGGCFINSAGLIRFNTDTEYSSVSDLIADLTSIQFVAKLATPTTVQLTPTQIQLLQGTNTLYASTGDISVTVNGVSGSIGAVQEQVNELGDRLDTTLGVPDDSGINQLQLTVSGIKSVNSGVTWEGNTANIGGVSYTIETDANNNVTEILVDGECISEGHSVFYLVITKSVDHKAYLTGCPAAGGATSYEQQLYDATNNIVVTRDYGDGYNNNPVLSNIAAGLYARIIVRHGYTADNLVFKPCIIIPSVEGRLEIVETAVPTAPTTDGTYVLTVTVADGTPTYSWESAE